MAVGVASVWCVVAAVSVDDETAFASGAIVWPSLASSVANVDGMFGVWKRFGMNCDAPRDVARLLTFDVTASRTCGFEREVLRLLSLASEVELVFVHERFFFNNNFL